MPALTLCSVCFEVWLGQGLVGGRPKPLLLRDVVTGAGVEADQRPPFPKGLSAAAFCNREGAWGASLIS